MATEQTSGQDPVEQPRGGMEGEFGSPISNDAYDIIACLHEKLQGLEAMRKFSKDADQDVWKELSKLDLQAVDTLLGKLEQLVKDGKLRSGMTAQRPTARS